MTGCSQKEADAIAAKVQSLPDRERRIFTAGMRRVEAGESFDDVMTEIEVDFGLPTGSTQRLPGAAE